MAVDSIKSTNGPSLEKMIASLDKCIDIVQQSMHQNQNVNNADTTLNVVSMCELQGLQTLSAMNGQRCKIIGAFDANEHRFPVNVFDVGKKVLIKPENLRLIDREQPQQQPVPQPEHDTQLNVIYDMETGDPDDLFAVLFLISHPMARLRAITITPGTLAQVGAIRNLLYAKLRMPPKSILIGSANLEHGKPCVPNGIWKTLCGPITESEPDGIGCDIIHETVTKYADCVIVTGAPLTNLYAYVKKYCTVDGLNKCNKKPLRWICQGGFAGDNVVPSQWRLSKFNGKTFVPTWNLNGNLKAAKYLLLDEHCYKVFAERLLVSKNVCHGVVYDHAFHEKMKHYKDRHRALRLIYDGMDAYLKKRHKDGKKLHDILAAMVSVNPKVVRFREIRPLVAQKKYCEWGAQLSSGSHIFISVHYDRDEFFDTFVGSK